MNSQIHSQPEYTPPKPVLDGGTAAAMYALECRKLREQLSAALAQCEAMRGALVKVLEAWDSRIIQGRLEYLALRNGGNDGTNEERSWIAERIDAGREALSSTPPAPCVPLEAVRKLCQILEESHEGIVGDWRAKRDAALILLQPFLSPNPPR